MASIHGQKELKRSWPVVTGLTDTAKHEGRQSCLVAEDSSNVSTNDTAGIR